MCWPHCRQELSFAIIKAVLTHYHFLIYLSGESVALLRLLLTVQFLNWVLREVAFWHKEAILTMFGYSHDPVHVPSTCRISQLWLIGSGGPPTEQEMIRRMWPLCSARVFAWLRPWFVFLWLEIGIWRWSMMGRWPHRWCCVAGRPVSWPAAATTRATIGVCVWPMSTVNVLRATRGATAPYVSERPVCCVLIPGISGVPDVWGLQCNLDIIYLAFGMHMDALCATVPLISFRSVKFGIPQFYFYLMPCYLVNW